jgi:glycosyltransferase involved in cell wall biosynthesis
MKIAYLMQEGVPDINQSLTGGAANHVRRVISELKNQGHQVRLVYKKEGRIWTSDDLEEFRPVTKYLFDQGILKFFEKAIRRTQSLLHLPYIGLFESVKFASACRQELAGFDLLYERMGWMGYGGSLASRYLGIPHILEVNSDHIQELETYGIAPKGIQRWLSLILMKNAVLNTSFIVAVGEGCRQSVISRWGADQEKITIIENGSDLVDKLERGELQSFSSTANNTTTIVYIGGFKTWHGLPVLIPALSKTVSQRIQVKLILIGSGPNEDEVKQLINQHNLNEYVTFAGHLSIDKYAPILANADIGVAPYCGWFEYTGLKLFDYKASGLAIIASGENGKPSSLKHGETGWIVPPCDEDALSQAIVLLSSDIELRRRIGRAARIEAESRHAWRHTAERLEQLFDRVVDNYSTKAKGKNRSGSQERG